MMSYEPHIGTDGAGEDGDGVRGWGMGIPVPSSNDLQESRGTM